MDEIEIKLPELKAGDIVTDIKGNRYRVYDDKEDFLCYKLGKYGDIFYCAAYDNGKCKVRNFDCKAGLILVKIN